MSIGLDIGTKTIKVIEFEKNGNNFVLRASGVVGYTGASVEKLSDEKDMAAISDIILKLFKSSAVKGKDVVLSLPESLVFTRSVKLPLLTDQEVAAAMKWEAEQYIPIPLKEAIIQHQILERIETGSSQQVVVLLVAAPRILVEKYISIVNGARLNVSAVETELMSMVRALSPANQTALLIDFGARSIDVAISKNGLLVFSRSIPTAGDALSRSLTATLGISPQEAEQYKTAYGLSSNQLEGKIKSALEPILAGIVDEIKKAVHFYQTEEKGDSPTSTILSGGAAGMPELISYMTNALGLEIQIANPFARIQVDKEMWPKVSPYAPLYSIAVGLAMR